MTIQLVKNLTLMPQDKTNGCWYFSAKMLHAWGQASRKTGIKDPATVNDNPPCDLKALYETNAGYSPATCRQLAPRLGLQALEKKKRGLEDFKTLLNKGPIWAAGNVGGATGGAHVVVIGGVADTGLLLFDPLPLNRGQKVWRTWEWMDTFFDVGGTTPDANLLVVA